ncbi:hypothetical protein [Prescottella agglutinans]|uniref:hypothetical protein n=1 Tax=Prescottella agglutinans TaxID=1644129 RepID=UPI003D97B9E4
MSVVISGMGLVAIPAPFLARWLIDSTGFRSLFWFTLICLAVLAPMILLTTAESNLRLHSRLDLVGAVLLGAGIGVVLVGISFGPDGGWTAPSTLAYLAGGAVLSAAGHRSSVAAGNHGRTGIRLAEHPARSAPGRRLRCAQLAHRD